jgi:hypothetical protein
MRGQGQKPYAGHEAEEVGTSQAETEEKLKGKTVLK